MCPAVPSAMCLPLATPPVPTRGAPGAGRLQLLPASERALRLDPSVWFQDASFAERPMEDVARGKSCRSPMGSGFPSAGGEDDGSCELNGRLYRDGETFQPHCRSRCRCEDGGLTCVPLCSEDVRLPSWDCPYPRRVEVPGKCCLEWVCDQGQGLGLQSLPAQGPQFSGLIAPAVPGIPCPEWSTAWGPCSTTCGLGVATRVSNQNRFCRLESQRRLCVGAPCPPARNSVF
ncbi:WNT1-inducible-signaling pathway protein 2 [Galemys pyrenaicus]|uniref:CCN family member 5 n=1 Tax=Galemys pyrenaicus TaxID=202257 RepID=A0A8J6DRZ7_GALPY|nr:WNT1-inducible-signaling pathway protein 2 [Galemys pyrenaicus]